MRCKNCNWPNKPSETNCVKCGSPLTPEDDTDLSYGSSSYAEVDRGVNETIREEDVFGSGSERHVHRREFAVETKEAGKQCPKCGYPLRPGTEKCPNCKFQISGFDRSSYSQREEPKKKPARRPTRLDSGGGSCLGTINPYMMNMGIGHSFVLKPIKRTNERHELEELEFEGESVLLNRGNTEADNLSITSREQAIVTNENGHWYIEDKSEQKTTFVQASNRIELKEGDLILLGNRLFEFHE